jgi:hypothetical protein
MAELEGCLVTFDTPSKVATLEPGKQSYDHEGPMKSRCTIMVCYSLPTEEAFPGIVSTSVMTKTLPSRPGLSSCTL